MASIINVCVFRSSPRPCSENPFSGLLREAFINTVRVCFLLPSFSHPYTIIFRGSLWQLSGKFRYGFSFTSQHIIASHAVWTQFINNSGSTANTSISKTTPRSQQAQPIDPPGGYSVKTSSHVTLDFHHWGSLLTTVQPVTWATKHPH